MPGQRSIMEQRAAQASPGRALPVLGGAIPGLQRLAATIARLGQRRLGGRTGAELERRAHVRDMIGHRRARARFFSGQLFGEPAWDILLELYAADLEQRSLSAGLLCLVSGAPSTTTLRWIAILCEKGLVDSAHGPGEQGAVSLTQAGRAAMDRYFSTISR